MIERSKLTDIGEIVKTHGIKGELNAVIDNGIDIAQLRCIVLEVDGIFVPFFINSFRPKGNEAVLLTIDGVDSDTEASKLCGLTIYALIDELPDYNGNDDEGFYLADLIGYKLNDSDGTNVGKITGYDDSTSNTLLIVESNTGSIHYVPMADDLIVEFNPETSSITLNLPSGLFEL